MKNRKNKIFPKFSVLAENINDPKKIYGWAFVVSLFSMASMLLSQTALYLAFRMKFG